MLKYLFFADKNVYLGHRLSNFEEIVQHFLYTREFDDVTERGQVQNGQNVRGGLIGGYAKIT